MDGFWIGLGLFVLGVCLYHGLDELGEQIKDGLENFGAYSDDE